jgi:hypothetical protein
MNFKSLVLSGAVAATLAFAGSAHAVVNPSFESGLTGWTATDALVAVVTESDTPPDILGPTPPYTATDGLFLAELTAGEEEAIDGSVAYTTLYQDFELTTASYLTLNVAFASFDYFPYNDDAYVRIYQIVDMTPVFFAQIYTASVASVGDYTAQPWQTVGRALAIGSYRVEAGVRNSTAELTEGFSPSRLVVDNVNIAVGVIPEPGAWALMILGFGATGAALRANRRRVLA